MRIIKGLVGFLIGLALIPILMIVAGLVLLIATIVPIIIFFECLKQDKWAGELKKGPIKIGGF